ncbi:hypothetical protein [Paracoccus sp. ME4]|uniref:hypothetical protein n=1 Tax=Paracoccus sp. ME4 TaxID=3138066 RepID=UPI00398A5D09
MKKLIAPLLALALAAPALAFAAPADETNVTAGLETGFVDLQNGRQDYNGVRTEIDGVRNALRYEARFAVGNAGDTTAKTADLSVGKLAYGDIVGPKVRYLHLDNGPRVEALALGGVGLYARPQPNVVVWSDALIGDNAFSTRIGGELGVMPKLSLLGEVEALSIDDEVSAIAMVGARYDIDRVGSLDFKVRHYDEGLDDGVKGTVGSVGLSISF